MLIDSFAPYPDVVETHRIEIAAPCEAVYQALWTADLGSSPFVKGLLALRSLPERIVHRGHKRRPNQKLTLETIIEAGFGRLAEEPGREIVLGVAGQFWRPLSNILPFNPEHFHGSAPTGLARAVWNFTVQETRAGHTLLSTETRVICGDPASRLKFRLYWLLIRPFSGLIRRLMLRAVQRACQDAARPCFW
jgi:hypothetical protein